MDIKTTFLNGVVKQEMYMEKPLETETHQKQTHVCMLNKGFVQSQKAPMGQHIQLLEDHLE